jgi:hypothetical protein
MTQAASVHGLAIKEPPLSPGPRPVVAPARVPARAPAERLLRFSEQNAPPRVQVSLRLTDGERISIASFESDEAAKQHAHVLMEEIATTREWLFLSGRFVRPDAIVSVDLNTSVF